MIFCNLLFLVRMMLVVVVVGVVGFAAAFFTAAFFIKDIIILKLLAASVQVALVTILMRLLLNWLASRKTHKWRKRISAMVSILILLLTLTATETTIFKSFNFPYTPLKITTRTRYWDLSTGSHIAYQSYPSASKREESPVIVLHGSPGVPIEDADFFADPLNQQGFDVYYYDQVGTGRSERLSDVKMYTINRQVADLEAIRLTIRAEKLILLGGSWGASLAAYYLAEYPQNVAKAILFSPGALWEPEVTE
jgi:predicted alpha/beta-fold hydrolase